MSSAAYPSGLCVNCLTANPDQAACSACGYHPADYQPHPLYLPAFTVLKRQYLIGRTLGQGGFGITYIGLDQTLRKRVAIKEYLPAALATRNSPHHSIIPIQNQQDTFAKGLRLFIDEARNLAHFDHPHIVRVLNYFEENQTGYMVMEYLEGESPADALRRERRLNEAAALQILLPVLDALQEVHAKQMYHLDVSAQNVRITRQGVPVLIDFGAARRVVGDYTHSVTLILKPGYSPLEQYSDEGKIGPWTDIYASAALLYLLCVGRLPPPAPERLETDRLLAPDRLGDAPLSPRLRQALAKALAVRPEERFADVESFRRALTETAGACQRRPLAGAALLMALLAGLGGAVYALAHKYPGPAGQAATPPPARPPIQARPQSPQPASPSPSLDSRVQIEVAQYQAQASQALQREEYEESLQAVEQGLRLLPTHAGLLQLRLAIASRRNAAAARREAYNLLMQQGMQEFTAGRWANAFHSGNAALMLQPNGQEAKTGLAWLAGHYVRQARQAWDEGRPDEARALAAEAREFFPDHAEALALQDYFAAAPDQEKQQQIKQLLQIVEAQIGQRRLMSPPGNNAYETCQQILQLSPQHPAALAALEKIADHYAALAGDQKLSPAQRQGMIDKGLRAWPYHAGLLALRETLKTEPKPEARIERIEPKEAPPAASPPPTEPARPAVATLEALLAQAAHYLNNANLDAGAEMYRRVLQLEPQSQQALEGLRQIADRYLEQALQQQGQPAASLLIAKGLSAAPGHPGLLALQGQIVQPVPPPPAGIPAQPSDAKMPFTPSF